MTKSIAVSKQPATPTLITFNTFSGARDKRPRTQLLTWPATCKALQRMVKTRAPKGDPSEAKKRLPAFNTAALSDPYNTNANVTALTALPIDADHSDWVRAIERAEAAGIAALFYTSPSHPNPDRTDRFRVVVPLTEPLAPEHVKHARKALAELLGIGPGEGVENADAESQVFFAGQFANDDARDFYTTEGKPVNTAGLVAAKLAMPWKRPAKPSAVKALERVAHQDPDTRTAALLEALADHWEAPGEANDRRGILRALGGYLARRGWSDGPNFSSHVRPPRSTRTRLLKGSLSRKRPRSTPP